MLSGVAGLEFGSLIAYYVAMGFLVALILVSLVNSFTQKVYVHPDDKLFGNIFTYILFMAVILTLGNFFDEQMKEFSYDAGVYILTTFVFVYLVLILARKIGFHELLDDTNKREKELIARFILFSILVGAGLVFMKYLYDQLYEIMEYGWGVVIIGASTFIVIMLIGISSWKKYEPVGTGSMDE
ncbi:hypothetical protein GF325_09970 [Candidatus Bathyarchaeota archaeon]|nr:hypothetical protein [Candidatus Bathyarchaeota archaeon]